MFDPILLYKALSEETRLKSLLLMQRQGEMCVCDLMQALNLSQPKVSRHLAELRKHELVLDERRGKWVYYRINPTLEPWVKQVLEITLNHNRPLIEVELQSMKGKSCSTGVSE
ncbi:metalloregulator ArsR/SmtB family transcription factor [Vibrio cholerae]|uniref:metalloregulator ArsR/SmtB family transcription factor n=2 Tax=Vibrionaceae TaxID=641 RepID=UPI0006ACA511|nr:MULTISPECIES: metalloregulator ArsR/SmtB family transcription factor [Vibrio]EGQ8325222.1 metalloregulator ArsR/SmtB family transcription factor [Vibrio cholerae]EGR0539272.1 metalloregulator ArsR/SmtB family transcription factor [Vibrio cholerae]EGR0609344.1 metalloregulator ArsR/SmtB family transcription factor [Vibrio cholerae]EGR2309151.1 metalloregulator ArsR/SmtB family transcription factor [Vibrio cholerae]EGR4151063.1 ArsR family transcriptional regulator [Vibrio cholerae]